MFELALSKAPRLAARMKRLEMGCIEHKFPDSGMVRVLSNGQIRRAFMSHLGCNRCFVVRIGLRSKLLGATGRQKRATLDYASIIAQECLHKAHKI